MSSYTKSTNFASKDALLTGNPLKVIKGTEIDDEYNAIQTAVNSKADINSPALTGTPTAPTASSETSTTQLATTAFVQAQKVSPEFTGTPIAPTASEGTDTTQIATTEFVGTAVETAIAAITLLPSGAVMPFATSTEPSGWLECDGSAVSRDTYSDLFSAIGTTFGSGNGSTTFNLPDLRGEFVRGWDNGRGLDSGRSFGTGQTATSISDRALDNNGTNDRHLFKNTDGTDGTVATQADASDTNSYTSTYYKVRPTNVALMYCIKT